ncbi:phenylalanine--tRNA ligase subunit alpha [Candidatus Saccharibacteria bacterium]|nr:phenylalanine--tRNA ligase subunit alpha [Candidatus Saccharibacteria bacterium]
MTYANSEITAAAEILHTRLQTLAIKSDILRAVELKALYDQLKTLPTDQKGSFGKEVNQLRNELQAVVDDASSQTEKLPAIDVTAPFECNTKPEDRPALLSSATGSEHPLTIEITTMLDIFTRMGFSAIESRELDDDYHMFGALNFPEDHPARGDYDTFMTVQTDANGKRLIAPAHTSVMQNRILKANKINLEAGKPIAAVMPGRVFRNEDLDATHEHTFHQLEGIYVDRGVHVGMLIATITAFLNEYFHQQLTTKIQPFYFPFTEPSFEFALQRPDALKKDDSEEQKWLELMGCGMIHPNVLREAGIDPEIYSGFAWGYGIERLVIMKYGIEDIRHFEAAKLDFLRQFA